MKVCAQCQNQNQDDASQCAKCGANLSATAQVPDAPPMPQHQAVPMQQFGAGPLPSTGKGMAITAIILGVLSSVIPLILGIIALVYGHEAKKRWATGEYAAAQEKAKTAKLLAKIGMSTRRIRGLNTSTPTHKHPCDFSLFLSVLGIIGFVLVWIIVIIAIIVAAKLLPW
jgi:hypothetical protein